MMLKLLLLCVFVATVYAQLGSRDEESLRTVTQWTLHSYPSPKENPKRCGLGERPSWVCDPDNVFTEGEVLALEETIERTCAHTPCPCSCSCVKYGCGGYTFSVAVLDKIPLHATTTRTEQHVRLVMEGWAEEFERRAWNYGDCDNDVVIIYSRYDKMVYTSFGSKARKTFEAPCVQLAYNKSQNLLDAGKFAEGIKQLIIEYRRILNNNSGCGPVDFRGEKLIIQAMLFCICAVAGLVGLVGWCVFSTKEGGHCTRVTSEGEEEDGGEEDVLPVKSRIGHVVLEKGVPARYTAVTEYDPRVEAEEVWETRLVDSSRARDFNVRDSGRDSLDGMRSNGSYYSPQAL